MNGHQDGFNKLACMVIPFGEWTGDKLCLYEARFVRHFKPWDILIFLSGQITHFNLHFARLHESLVLYSDKEGDMSHAVAR